jgi:hypothetical protein
MEERGSSLVSLLGVDWEKGTLVERDVNPMRSLCRLGSLRERRWAVDVIDRIEGWNCTCLGV